MKRSEMLEHISAEMLQYANNRKHSNETDEKYYTRKASYLLDMLQGFGMLPPPKSVDCATDYLLYAYYDKVENVNGNDEEVNVPLLWDKEK